MIIVPQAAPGLLVVTLSSIVVKLVVRGIMEENAAAKEALIYATEYKSVLY